mgnify:CR=1 FL=1
MPLAASSLPTHSTWPTLRRASTPKESHLQPSVNAVLAVSACRMRGDPCSEGLGDVTRLMLRDSLRPYSPLQVWMRQSSCHRSRLATRSRSQRALSTPPTPRFGCLSRSECLTLPPHTSLLGTVPWHAIEKASSISRIRILHCMRAACAPHAGKALAAPHLDASTISVLAHTLGEGAGDLGSPTPCLRGRRTNVLRFVFAVDPESPAAKRAVLPRSYREVSSRTDALSLQCEGRGDIPRLSVECGKIGSHSIPSPHSFSCVDFNARGGRKASRRGRA